MEEAPVVDTQEQPPAEYVPEAYAEAPVETAPVDGTYQEQPAELTADGTYQEQPAEGYAEAPVDGTYQEGYTDPGQVTEGYVEPPVEAAPQVDEGYAQAPQVTEGYTEAPVEGSPVSYVTQEQLDEANEAFQLFDKQSPGWIFTKDFSMVMRSLGYSVSATDLKAMEADADPNGSGYISQGDFIRQIYRAVELSQVTSANSRKAMQAMADSINGLLAGVVDQNGTLDPEDFRHIMTRVGEKLSNEEFNDLCAGLDMSSGRISVDNVINFLML